MNGQGQQPQGPGMPPVPGGQPMQQNTPTQQPQQSQGLQGIVASSAQYAQEWVQAMVSQGIGVGGYSNLNYYAWVTATDQERRMNPQAGENLLWVLPQRANEPHLGRPEASHWMNHLNRGFRCVASMFPERGMRCPICDALQQIAQIPGVDINRMGAQWRYNLCVVDAKNPQMGVQVVTLSDRLFLQIYQVLANNDLPEADRDFTNPMGARPWQIIRKKTKGGKIRYEASLYPITPRPMAVKQDGTPDVETMQYWINTCPKLWDIITFPNDEMMTEITTVAYDLINYWTNKPQAGPAIGMPARTQVPAQGMMVPGATGGFQQGQPAQGAGQPVQTGPPPIPQGNQVQGTTAPLNPISQPPGMAQPAGQPQTSPGVPGAYSPSLMPDQQLQHPNLIQPNASPGSPGYIPPLQSAPAVAPGGSAPPGLGDQSPPPPMGMPGQQTQVHTAPAPQGQPQQAIQPTPQGQPAQAAQSGARTACFGQYDPDRIMCSTCKDKTECAEQSPKKG